MNNNLSQDIGENYEYIKTILQNKVELAKLDLIENSADIGSSLITLMVVAIFSFVIVTCLLISIGVLLAQATGSILYACLIIGSVFAIGLVTILKLRERLINNPLSNFFYRKFLK